MAIAFLSDVNEAHILNGKYDEGERERVIKAAKKMQEIPLWVECIPDFSIADIENTIKDIFANMTLNMFVWII